MENPRVQAFASRYTAALINSAPPSEIVLSKEEFSHAERDAVYRVLNQIRERLLAEAKILDSLSSSSPKNDSGP